MITTAPWYFCFGPAALAAVSVLPESICGARGQRRTQMAQIAAVLSVALAVGSAVAVAALGRMHTPLVGSAGIGFSVYVDALTAMMSVLVAFIGLIVVSYSRNYLDGEPRQDYFIRCLCITLAAILLVILSGNFLQFALAWLATSMALQRLLLFYPERQAAMLAARKKFLASRLGDLCLLGGMILLYQLFGSLEYTTIFHGAAALTGSSAPAALHVAALLLATTALLKSAQFPLHGWIVEVMETPTPVSALLHAGIVNAGGFLVIRFSEVMAASTPAMHTLAVIGGFTALFGSVVMLPQTSIKVSLAYSTIAQMGFMMLECGLGAFSAAMLHILAHSPYKAHAFLSSGSVIDIARTSWTPSPGGKPHPARMAISVIAVLAVTLVVSTLFGATITEKPGEFTLGAVLVLALILLLSNGIDERPNGYVVGRAIVLAAAVAIGYFALQYGIGELLWGSVVPTQTVHGPLDIALVVMVIASFGLVTIFQGLLPGQAAQPRWQALYAHLANGLYVNTIANRWLLSFWPSRPRQSLSPGRLQ